MQITSTIPKNSPLPITSSKNTRSASATVVNDNGSCVIESRLSHSMLPANEHAVQHPIPVLYHSEQAKPYVGVRHVLNTRDGGDLHVKKDAQ